MKFLIQTIIPETYIKMQWSIQDVATETLSAYKEETEKQK